MHKKALTVAIAGALAAPMAAQAVDMTVSGHINRALFVTDSESSTSAKVKDNGSSGTRIRVTGSGEMMDGGAAGVNLEYGATDTLGLRYAEVWFSGGYGKVSIGQGDQGGEGSVYNGAAAVTGTGHGQDTNGIAGDYYTSLDGGAGRNERLRYDSADLGPISAAVSIGNGDQISAGLKLTQDLGGTTFKAGVGTIQWAGGQSTISASAGVTLDSGISISGAWGQGTDHAGMTMPGMDAVMGMDRVTKDLNFTLDPSADIYNMDGDDLSLNEALEEVMPEITASDGVEQLDALSSTNLGDRWTGMDAMGEPLSDDRALLTDEQKMAVMEILARGAAACSPAVPSVGVTPIANCTTLVNLGEYEVEPGKDGSPAVPEMPTTTDPSMLQVAISFAFGDTSVGLSWYQSSDKYREGSELTAIGAGVNHNLPKLGANVYAAAQNYNVTDGSYESDDTVIMIGTRIKF